MKVWVQMIFLFNWVNFRLFQLFIFQDGSHPSQPREKYRLPKLLHCCSQHWRGRYITKPKNVQKKKSSNLPYILYIFEVFRNVSFPNKNEFLVTIPVLPKCFQEFNDSSCFIPPRTGPISWFWHLPRHSSSAVITWGRNNALNLLHGLSSWDV